ncbi:MAG: SufS family cysteine desulfurase [Saprospiraceae bacterium]|jgi:cysteine desulfurase / selenocysteine lyase|nr:SufS family cysteine desulfurase [Saprospiraceae bacterium]MDP4998239.1 SufS family cysteine desulfurase [Saprospiraceae bacterium]
MIHTDIPAIRDQFPIFAWHRQENLPFVYLDNAATTLKPTPVIEAMHDYYSNYSSNIHRGLYPIAVRASKAYEDARVKVQQFFGAAHPEEIVFTQGTTAGINLVAAAFAGGLLQPGDEILLSPMEHHANLVPWQQISAHHNLRLRFLPMDAAGNLQLDQLDTLADFPIKLIAIVHISNTLGHINDLETIIAWAKQRNIRVLVDAAQSAALYPMDVQQLGMDFLVCSGHKMYGPTGIGVLYGKKELLEQMPPYQSGGDMIKKVGLYSSTFADIPHKFEAGTPPIAAAIGLGAALDFLQTLNRPQWLTHLDQLTDYTIRQLREIPGLKIMGEAQKRSHIISFTLQDIHPHDIATFLAQEGIAIRAGHHCTQPLMQHFDTGASARASLSIYNTQEDIDALIQALHHIQSFFNS